MSLIFGDDHAREHTTIPRRGNSFSYIAGTLWDSIKLARQMEHAEGHFYYSGNDNSGKDRRRQLAKTLYQKGLR